VHDVIVGELHVRFFLEVAVQDRSLLLLVIFVSAILSMDPSHDAEEVKKTTNGISCCVLMLLNFSVVLSGGMLMIGVENSFVLQCC